MYAVLQKTGLWRMRHYPAPVQARGLSLHERQYQQAA